MSTAVRTIVFALVAPLAMACAQGGSGTDLPIDSSGGADAKPIDAPNNPGNDAPVLPADAMIDAQPVDASLGDAPPGSGLFCTDHAMCTNAGECCFDFIGQAPTGVCAQGTLFLGECLPN